MINSRKKGFTLVELVIVIAVVAVLAAVLIPNFGNSVKKANMSDDQQAVVQMNKLLALDEVADPKPETTDAVVEVLIKNDYSDYLTTYYSDYKLVCLKEHNAIVLVENDTFVYPEKYAGESNFEELKPMVKDVEESFESLQNGETWYNSAIQVINQIKQNDEGKYVVYGQQAELIVNSGMYSGKIAIQISAPGGNVTINGGNFIGTEYVINSYFNPQSYIDRINYESVITINPDSITTGQVRINGTVINNGNGTWTV